MDALAQPLLAYYIAVMLVLCVYGVHRYALVWIYFRRRGAAADPAPRDRFRTLPAVTVQLPMFNERAVAERVIEAACAIDYPRDRLEVQVLDDSTDDSAAIVRACCDRLAAAGHDVKLLHRTDRSGYKAGALAAGLETARGELIAVFDADFVPPPGFLRDTVHHFTDPGVGMVQTRWTHLNRDASLLTRIQAVALDAHFVLEQAARAWSGRWFNFNGTAGIWRRRCIEDAGGWQHDTLTEDTDLSYRAQLAGWSFRFLPGVCCGAELPPTVAALLGQQHRWMKGLTQTAIKLLPRILASRAPLRTRVEAWFHLTSALPYVGILTLALLAGPALFVTLPLEGVRTALALGVGLACLGLGTLAACVFYVVSQAVQGRSVVRAIALLPALMAVGVGVSVINTKAMLEAVFGLRSPFVRTPKFAGGRRADRDPAGVRRRLLPAGAIETGLGLAMIACIGLALTSPFTLVGVPFLLLFATGFLAIGAPMLARG